MSEDKLEHHEVVLKILGPVPKYAECEIVRCRDCKHRAGANVQAVVSDLCMWLNIIVNHDGFCAWGERKVDK